MHALLSFEINGNWTTRNLKPEHHSSYISWKLQSIHQNFAKKPSVSIINGPKTGVFAYCASLGGNGNGLMDFRQKSQGSFPKNYDRKNWEKITVFVCFCKILGHLRHVRAVKVAILSTKWKQVEDFNVCFRKILQIIIPMLYFQWTVSTQGSKH